MPTPQSGSDTPPATSSTATAAASSAEASSSSAVSSSGAPDRAVEFQAEIAAMRSKTSRQSLEQILLALGIVLMLAGVVLGIIGYFASTNASDPRDQNEYIILGLLGISLTLIGTVVFLRYSIARFLRFWLLRQIYEKQNQ